MGEEVPLSGVVRRVGRRCATTGGLRGHYSRALPSQPGSRGGAPARPSRRRCPPRHLWRAPTVRFRPVVRPQLAIRDSSSTSSVRSPGRASSSCARALVSSTRSVPRRRDTGCRPRAAQPRGARYRRHPHRRAGHGPDAAGGGDERHHVRHDRHHRPGQPEHRHGRATRCTPRHRSRDRGGDRARPGNQRAVRVGRRPHACAWHRSGEARGAPRPSSRHDRTVRLARRSPGRSARRPARPARSHRDARRDRARLRCARRRHGSHVRGVRIGLAVHCALPRRLRGDGPRARSASNTRRSLGRSLRTHPLRCAPSSSPIPMARRTRPPRWFAPTWAGARTAPSWRQRRATTPCRCAHWKRETASSSPAGLRRSVRVDSTIGPLAARYRRGSTT